MNSSDERYNRWPIIISVLAVALAIAAKPTFAALTFSGTQISGDSSVMIDTSSTISLGTSNASGITIGRSTQSVAFPGNVSTTNLLVIGSATTTSLTVTSLGSSGSPCLSVGTNGVVATTTCGGGNGTPGGSNSQIEYNNGGSFGGDANLEWSSSMARLVVASSSGSLLVGTSTQPDNALFAVATSSPIFEVLGNGRVSVNGGANNLNLQGSAVGNPTIISATGTDTSVPIQLLPKGLNGPVAIGPLDGIANIESFHGGVAYPGAPATPIDFLIQNRLSNNGWSGQTITSASGDGTWPYVEFLKARGTLANPAAVSGSSSIYGYPAGDLIGEIANIAFNGSSYAVSSLIDARAIGNGRAGQLEFTIADSSGNFSQATPNYVLNATGMSMAGNLGVGTTSPSMKLYVFESGSAPTLTDSANTAIGLQNSVTNNTNARLDIISGSAGSSILQLGNSSADDNGSIYYNNSTKAFGIRTNGVNNQFTVDGSGNVAIASNETVGGTLNASSTVTVTKSGVGSIALLSGASGSHTSYTIGRTSNDGYLGVAAGGGGQYVSGSVAGDIVLVSNTGKVVLGTGGTDSSAGTARLTINATGNVGIGTTVPSSTLHVAGASSTITIGTASLPGCIEVGNSNGSGGINYVTFLNGVMTATTTKPSNCQ